ncbi:MAG TPA: hypothetical protein VHK47_10170 [Polyangia bacterium]|nr:hypothetical protein [Polyangia bacterium]
MDKLEDMDEELAKARQKDADGVDIYRYKRRFRTLKAVGLGAVLAGLVSLIMVMIEDRKNPCQKVHDYLCKKDPAGLQCKSYEGILDESEHDSSAEMRSQIRSQCQDKIDRLKEDEGIDIK